MKLKQVDEFLNWLTRNGSRLEHVGDSGDGSLLLDGRALSVDELQERAEEWLIEQGASVTEAATALVITVAKSRVAKGSRIWPPCP